MATKSRTAAAMAKRWHDEPIPERPSILVVLEQEALSSQSPKMDRKSHKPLLRVTGTLLSQRQFSKNFSVIDIELDKGECRAGYDSDVTVKGFVGTLQPGCLYRFTGVRENNNYGEALFISTFEVVRPSDVEGVRRFLGSGVLPELGAKRSSEFVDLYGAQALDILDGPEEPAVQALRQVKGITEQRARAIVEAYRSRTQERELLPKLFEYGLSTWEANKLMLQYGNQALRVLKEDPYQLAYDVAGFAFLRTDSIARRAGMADNDPRRNRAAVVHLLDTAAENGHTWQPTEELLKNATKELKLVRSDVEQAIQDLLARKPSPIVAVRSREGVDGFARVHLYNAETTIAEALSAAVRIPVKYVTPPGSLERYGLTDEQAGFVQAALKHRVGILTGGPGTGKTHTTRALLDQLVRLGVPVMLCAPTGKAAIRMREATGRTASTIHSLLRYNGDEFGMNEIEPLPGGCIVVDESSMVDVQLMEALVKAIQFTHTQLILVGDVDQLPSVGAGAVLRDLIESGVLPVTRLAKIHRQAEGSKIITNAHRILHGEMPEGDEWTYDDWHWFAHEDHCSASVVADDLVRGITEWLRDCSFGERPVDPIRDAQVLTCQHKLELGVSALNERLQALLNPPDETKGEWKLGSRLFRQGDKVMQTRNNRKLGVMNGEIGIAVSVDASGMDVDFGEPHTDLVRYESDNAHDLTIAYAITVHKYQGSQCPIIVMPVHAQQWFMLERAILYTAVTRAEKVVALFGERRALHHAVTDVSGSKRCTMLCDLLREGAQRAGRGELHVANLLGNEGSKGDDDDCYQRNVFASATVLGKWAGERLVDALLSGEKHLVNE